MPARLLTVRLCSCLAVMLGCLATPLGCWAARAAVDAVPGQAEPTDEEISRLVEQLGDADYAVREAAARRLADIGTAAADRLLTAAEVSDDLEVALRARWLVEAIPPSSPADPAEVAAALAGFAKADFSKRVQIMHRLLRFDDDAGIEPLARIVRLERSAAGSRVAAALLAREWRAGDAAWASMRPKIAAGVRTSERPAAKFLRAVVAASAPTVEPASLGRAADEAAAVVAVMDRAAAAGEAGGDGAAESAGDRMTLAIFRRTLVDLQLAAGRRDQAIDSVRRMMKECRPSGDEDESVDNQLAGIVVWAVDHGLPEAVDCLADRWPDLAIDEPLPAYAAALAFRARGDHQRATTLAAAAGKQLSAAADSPFANRLRAAILLARWGATDWATGEYDRLVSDPRTPVSEFAFAGILYAEFLHDQQRESEAAAILRTILDGGGEREAVTDDVLLKLQRDTAMVRGRMHFFESCAAEARGDTAGRRRALEDAVRVYPKEVDSLIALYKLPDNAAEQKAATVDRIERVLKQVDDEISAVPNDANSYNEYAWLVANTEGDLRKATRYSKKSLELSFDSSSYLDTLAHCRAAAGDFPGAIRTQSLALRGEPHNATLRRNLERFQRDAERR